MAACLLAWVTACEVIGQPDQDAIDHFLANATAFQELNRTVGELPDDILSLAPGHESGTVRLKRKPAVQDPLTEESTEYSVLLESFANLDLALISRSGGYVLFHRNPVDDGGVQHFFEYISQPVKNESMRCNSNKGNTRSIRSCLIDLDHDWSMWIKTLPSADPDNTVP